MNHIQRLAEERNELAARLQHMQDELLHVIIYLQSPKFYNDDTVHVRTDMLPKLYQLRDAYYA